MVTSQMTCKHWASDEVWTQVAHNEVPDKLRLDWLIEIVLFIHEFIF